MKYFPLVAGTSLLSGVLSVAAPPDQEPREKASDVVELPPLYDLKIGDQQVQVVAGEPATVSLGGRLYAVELKTAERRRVELGSLVFQVPGDSPASIETKTIRGGVEAKLVEVGADGFGLLAMHVPLNEIGPGALDHQFNLEKKWGEAAKQYGLEQSRHEAFQATADSGLTLDGAVTEWRGKVFNGEGHMSMVTRRYEVRHAAQAYVFVIYDTVVDKRGMAKPERLDKHDKMLLETLDFSF